MTDDHARQAIDEAWQAWRDAEKAYRDESGKYVAMWWEGEAVRLPEKVVDREAMESLARLRAAAEKAQTDYDKATRRQAPR